MLKLLHSQIFVKPILDPSISFAGQTVIVTGANTGLGREAARLLVERNAVKVILGVRSIEKGQQAKDLIDRTTKKNVTEVWEVDLSSYASVKAFARRAQSLDRIDAIIENAGMWPYEHNELEGQEATITVNVISTYLMALMLLPKLHETASRFSVTPRIVQVNSALHKFAKFSAKSAPSIFQALREPIKNFDMRYQDSKVIDIIYGQKLADAMTKSGKPAVTLNFVNPGYCVSDLIREKRRANDIGEKILARTTEEGGFALVDAVVAGKPERHGKYLSDMIIETPVVGHKTKSGKPIGEKLWQELNEILDNIEPGLLDVLH